MTNKQYLELVESECKKIISERQDVEISELEMIQVWYCKTVQNHKGLFICKNIITNIIYPYFIEATCNGDKNEIYLDFYNKSFKHTVHYGYTES